MKLSEVMRELENGSTRTYSATYEDGTRVTMRRDGNYPDFIKYDHEGIACDQQSRIGYFSGNCRLDADWEMIREPVNWQEALQVWSCGVDISCEIGGAVYKMEAGDRLPSITKRMMNYGEWYIGGAVGDEE